MQNYTDTEKYEDFEFFKSINADFFRNNGHKFLAIKNATILDFSDSIKSLIEKMANKSYEVGTYLIQECTGDNSAYTTTVMRLMMNKINSSVFTSQ